MMISAAPPEARQSPPSSQPAKCSQIQEQRGLPIDIRRMAGLDKAAALLGKGRLADELCITVRALNYKIDAGRGVSDADVVAAARGLEERAEKFLEHAQKLRAVISPAVSETVTAAPLGQASIVLAHCDHVERFAYERQGHGLDASPHMLAAAARMLAEAILPKTKSIVRAAGDQVDAQ